MSEGIKTVIYPASDLARAKAMFGAVLGAPPVMDESYYVQFQAGDQAIGLDPHGHKSGAVGMAGRARRAAQARGRSEAGRMEVRTIPLAGAEMRPPRRW